MDVIGTYQLSPHRVCSFQGPVIQEVVIAPVRSLLILLECMKDIQHCEMVTYSRSYCPVMAQVKRSLRHTRIPGDKFKLLTHVAYRSASHLQLKSYDLQPMLVCLRTQQLMVGLWSVYQSRYHICLRWEWDKGDVPSTWEKRALASSAALAASRGRMNTLGEDSMAAIDRISLEHLVHKEFNLPDWLTVSPYLWILVTFWRHIKKSDNGILDGWRDPWRSNSILLPTSWL